MDTARGGSGTRGGSVQVKILVIRVTLRFSFEEMNLLEWGETPNGNTEEETIALTDINQGNIFEIIVLQTQCFYLRIE